MFQPHFDKLSAGKLSAGEFSVDKLKTNEASNPSNYGINSIEEVIIGPYLKGLRFIMFPI